MMMIIIIHVYEPTDFLFVYFYQDLSFKLKSNHSKVEFLRECAQTLDNILPTAEARAECQKTFLNVLEKVER